MSDGMICTINLTEILRPKFKGGLHSTEVAYLLPTQQPHLGVPKYFSLDVGEIN